MKVIELKCCCGATARFQDERSSYVRDGGYPDEKGRKFVVEVQAERWLDRHDACTIPPEDRELIEEHPNEGSQ